MLINDITIQEIMHATILIVIALAAIFVIYKIIDRIAMNKTVEILSSFDYYKNVKKYMDLIFWDNAGLHSRIQVSPQTVNYFSSQMQQYNYLVKYFDLHVDEKTTLYLKELKKYVVAAFKKGKSCKSKRVKKYIFDDIPSLGMYYISPQGRSGLSCTLTLTPYNINDLIEKINKRCHIQSSSRYQRNLMNNQIRETILSRDNWTCKKCGNSIYTEPSLLLEVDHIIPISAGGKTEPNNLQTLCWRCNREKSNKLFY